MTAEEGAGEAFFRGPLPEGFARRVFRIGPGLELGLASGGLLDAIMVVEQGELELEFRTGVCRRFGRGSMIPVGRLPTARLRCVGGEPLILVAVSRTAASDR